MYPSECGRALKYITCKGKNGSSIIPKRDAEKRQLLQRLPNPTSKQTSTHTHTHSLKHLPIHNNIE